MRYKYTPDVDTVFVLEKYTQIEATLLTANSTQTREENGPINIHLNVIGRDEFKCQKK